MGLRQLKSVDIWALGLLFFCVVNPGLSTPYSYEFKTGEIQPQNYMSHMKSMLAKNQLPSPLPEFALLQNTSWKNIYDAFQRCATFENEKRPTASEVLEILTSACNINQDQTGAQLTQDNDKMKVCVLVMEGFVK